MHACDRERQRDVLLRGEHRQEVEELEDEADVLATQLRQARVVEVGDVDSFDRHGARGRLVEPRKAVHQRRLARARRAHHGREVAVVDFEGDAAQRVDARAALSVAASYVLGGDGNSRRRRCFGDPGHGSYPTDPRRGKPRGRTRRRRRSGDRLRGGEKRRHGRRNRRTAPLRPCRSARSAGTTAAGPASRANDSRATAGMRKTATCALDEIAISDASTMPPRRAITTAPPCSAAFPTIATMTVAMKNSDRPAARAKPSSECTRISLMSAVTAVASPRATRARGRLHARACASSVCAARWRRRFLIVVIR